MREYIVSCIRCQSSQVLGQSRRRIFVREEYSVSIWYFLASRKGPLILAIFSEV